jgi:Cys-tRNA(Pro) deacylase
MSKDKFPVTNAIRLLRERDVPFEPIVYKYVPKGGTSASSEELGVDEHQVIKTLVMETDAHEPLILLMHGDRQASTKNLARAIGAKSVRPCEPKTAEKHTGYFVGGTSPFGTKRRMPIYVESTIFDLETIYINAGRRGLLVKLHPEDILKAIEVEKVNVGI